MNNIQILIPSANGETAKTFSKNSILELKTTNYCEASPESITTFGYMIGSTQVKLIDRDGSIKKTLTNSFIRTAQIVFNGNTLPEQSVSDIKYDDENKICTINLEDDFSQKDNPVPIVEETNAKMLVGRVLQYGDFPVDYAPLWKAYFYPLKIGSPTDLDGSYVVCQTQDDGTYPIFGFPIKTDGKYVKIEFGVNLGALPDRAPYIQVLSAPPKDSDCQDIQYYEYHQTGIYGSDAYAYKTVEIKNPANTIYFVVNAGRSSRPSSYIINFLYVRVNGWSYFSDIAEQLDLDNPLYAIPKPVLESGKFGDKINQICAFYGVNFFRNEKGVWGFSRATKSYKIKDRDTIKRLSGNTIPTAHIDGAVTSYYTDISVGDYVKSTKESISVGGVGNIKEYPSNLLFQNKDTANRALSRIYPCYNNGVLSGTAELFFNNIVGLDYSKGELIQCGDLLSFDGINSAYFPKEQSRWTVTERSLIYDGQPYLKVGVRKIQELKAFGSIEKKYLNVVDSVIIITTLKENMMSVARVTGRFTWGLPSTSMDIGSFAINMGVNDIAYFYDGGGADVIQIKTHTVGNTVYFERASSTKGAIRYVNLRVTSWV